MFYNICKMYVNGIIRHKILGSTPTSGTTLFSIFVRNPCFNWDYLVLFLYVKSYVKLYSKSYVNLKVINYRFWKGDFRNWHKMGKHILFDFSPAQPSTDIVPRARGSPSTDINSPV